MITIIHGDDIAASRTYFQNLKAQSINPTTFDGSAVTLTDLVQVVEGGGLFAKEQTIFIESLLTKKKASKEIDAILSYIPTIPASISLTIWENKELTKAALAGFPKAQIRVYKLPQTLFTFLDNVLPGNAQKAIDLFHQTRKVSEDEMIFFMLIRQFRILLGLTDNTTAIDEIKRIAPWQKGKLEKQARAFSQPVLRHIYQQLAAIDLGLKTGDTTVPLAHTIDILLLSL